MKSYEECFDVLRCSGAPMMAYAVMELALGMLNAKWADLSTQQTHDYRWGSVFRSILFKTDLVMMLRQLPPAIICKTYPFVVGERNTSSHNVLTSLCGKQIPNNIQVHVRLPFNSTSTSLFPSHDVDLFLSRVFI